MRAAQFQVAEGSSTQIRCNDRQAGATNCTPSKQADMARGRWPIKTAEHWAEAAGVKVRMAKYWLAPGRKCGAAGKIALANEALSDN